ncbi:MAG: DUF4040 domain-containing protein [Kiritimatiellae bacterium]|nr:DUF4040 domain-containing protein [Kiritimatiellia bacterium]MDW8459318.1 proton-conducting transporter membrane subunit [Verrucomicrobiota bacterium]
MLLVVAILGVSAFAAPLLLRRCGRWGVWALTALPAAGFLYFITKWPAIQSGTALVSSIRWLPALGHDLTLRLDGLALLFAVLICGIGAVVVAYSGGYLRGDPAAPRFFASLFLFMASMLGVTLADDVVALFVFWELTSFSSYLLIGHHHEEEKSRKAALQALLVTGLGGLFLLAGLLMLSDMAGSTTLSGILASGQLADHPYFDLSIGLILVGAFTKSAQFPFHFWLPNAMAAPTPASAYLHSSTMVKAGVYLLARLRPIGSDSALWDALVPAIGAATLLTGALLAYGQKILKRLLAYTTVGALGMMTMLLGLDSPTAGKAAVAVLLAHALYKAALFLTAGIIDHETGEKDVERLSGLRRQMPLTAAGAALAAVSMMGLPPSFGYIAKETLYAAAVNPVLLVSAVLGGALFLVIAYLTGLKPFLGRIRPTPHPPHEAEAAMWAGPMILGLLGLVLGLAPGFTSSWLVAPAAAAVVGEPIAAKLTLWHGISRELIASGVTLLLGLMAVGMRRYVLSLLPAIASLNALGPDRSYERALNGLMWMAGWQTRRLQCGSLQVYLWITLSFVIATTGWYFLKHIPVSIFHGLSPVRFIDALILSLIILSTAGAIMSRSRLAAFASLGVAGYAIAIFFVIYSAPDLAMTQLVVETLTVILLVLAFYHLPPFRVRTTAPVRLLELVPAALVGLVMFGLTLAANRIQYAPNISGFFNEHSWTSAYGKNIVNVILVDFRALDTLGEITVLAVAGLGAFALLKLKPSGKGGGP